MTLTEESADTVISLQMSGPSVVSGANDVRARELAIRMFAAAGLRLEWCQRPVACRNWDERIVVTVEKGRRRRGD